jgi:hypothetical protein
MCSSWSRTQRNTPRRAAGDSPTLKMESRATRRCTRLAFPATCLRKIVTTSSLVTHVNVLRLRSGEPIKSIAWTLDHQACLRSTCQRLNGCPLGNGLPGNSTSLPQSSSDLVIDAVSTRAGADQPDEHENVQNLWNIKEVVQPVQR